MGLSISDIAVALGIKRHKVLYTIRVLGINPEHTAGKVRVYDASILSTISAEFQKRRLRMAVNG